jgi:hypothetical protein
LTWDEDNNPAQKTDPQGCCGFDPKGSTNTNLNLRDDRSAKIRNEGLER